MYSISKRRLWHLAGKLLRPSNSMARWRQRMNTAQISCTSSTDPQGRKAPRLVCPILLIKLDGDATPGPHVLREELSVSYDDGGTEIGLEKLTATLKSRIISSDCSKLALP